METAKKTLWAAGERQYQLERLKEQAETLRQEQQCLRELQSIPLDGMPRGNGVGDSTGRKTVAVLELEEVLQQNILPMMEKLLAEQNRLEMLLLQMLGQEEYTVVKKRYFERKSFACIAGELFCSRSTCYKVHQRAVGRLGKVL